MSANGLVSPDSHRRERRLSGLRFAEEEKSKKHQGWDGSLLLPYVANLHENRTLNGDHWQP